MSVKKHFLYCHLDYFAKNGGDLNEEQGECFPQERALTRLVVCKLSRQLLLVLEIGCVSCQAQKEVLEKTFHP